MIGFLTFFFHYEVLLKALEEFGGRETVEVAHHAVIVDYLEVRGRESHSEEVVVFLIATMVGILLCLLIANKSCGGTAMMSVGYIEIGNRLECGCDTVVESLINYPESMTESIGSHEVILRLAGGDSADHIFKVGIVGESEEHRLDIGVVDAHMLHSVFFFIAAGEFVFLNAPLHIVGDGGCNYDTVLSAAVHGLGVDIIVLMLVLHKPAVGAECSEIIYRFLIYALVVLIRAGAKSISGLMIW